MKKIISILLISILAASVFAVSYKNNTFQKLCKFLLCHEEVSMAYVNPIFYGAIDTIGPLNELDVLIVAALLEEMCKENFDGGRSMHPEAFTGTVSAFIGAEDFGFLILWQIAHLLSVAEEQVLSCLS